MHGVVHEAALGLFCIGRWPLILSLESLDP